MTHILWLRADLRLSDNPALHALVSGNKRFVPVYILDSSEAKPMGGAAKVWLHHSLQALEAEFARHNCKIIYRTGDPVIEIPRLAEEIKAEGVFWNRLYDEHSRIRDEKVKVHLKAKGLGAQSFNASLLYEPWDIVNNGGTYYKVFTPFWKACLASGFPRSPYPAPGKITPAFASVESTDKIPHSLNLVDLKLLPQLKIGQADWSIGITKSWKFGERAGLEALDGFVKSRLSEYADKRDLPATDGTSRISPYLRFGQISPYQAWDAAFRATESGVPGEITSKATAKFLAELGWREFSYNLLYHFPKLGERNFRPEFDGFPWQDEPEMLKSWQQGITGYPIVDAGMRQLYETGWMHNRVRMIVASFLTKHCLIDWRMGEEWFWDTLVDADYASNAASWQWVAGCGADAAPYFRIFNPIIQGERFDPNGDYVRKWVPEVSRLPNSVIHKPWEASALVLKEAGITLGVDYPKPLVNHEKARTFALAAYEMIKKN
jgi:deoxyribodipyrimidine photo-lyase